MSDCHRVERFLWSLMFTLNTAFDVKGDAFFAKLSALETMYTACVYTKSSCFVIVGPFLMIDGASLGNIFAHHSTQQTST